MEYEQFLMISLWHLDLAMLEVPTELSVMLANAILPCAEFEMSFHESKWQESWKQTPTAFHGTDTQLFYPWDHDDLWEAGVDGREFPKVTLPNTEAKIKGPESHSQSLPPTLVRTQPGGF